MSTDRELVQSTVADVAHTIDAKRWPELRALYADQVRTDYTSLFGGAPQLGPADALVAGWQKLLTPVVTQHLLGPVDVTLEGDAATAHCHVRAWHFLKDAPGGEEWVVAGHYVFRLVRRAGGWRIGEMTLQAFYQTGNTRLLELAASR
ncbi:MAG: nuclear transport factor 2 family protein [Anaeromyxobacter sp.]